MLENSINIYKITNNEKDLTQASFSLSKSLKKERVENQLPSGNGKDEFENGIFKLFIEVFDK